MQQGFEAVLTPKERTEIWETNQLGKQKAEPHGYPMTQAVPQQLEQLMSG